MQRTLDLRRRLYRMLDIEDWARSPTIGSTSETKA
jgi:hypothetical protein